MMVEQGEFVLSPFKENSLQPAISLSGSAVRSDNSLFLSYMLVGTLSELDIPQPEPKSKRLDNLWQTTCLEFFLAGADTSRYWEFNLSPSACWNVYRFTDYREGMAVETAIADVPFQVSQTGDRLLLEVEVDLNALLLAKTRVSLAIAAVIQQASGGLSYWALYHPGKQADFHDREGFVLEL